MYIDKNLNVGDDPSELVNLTHSTNAELPYIDNRTSQPAALTTNTTLVSPGFDKDPIVDDAFILQLSIGPITTTDELLRQDKSKVQISVGPSNLTAACLKDGRVLSKFWCEDVSDNTDIEHESDSLIQKSIPQSDFYLVSPTEKLKSTKRGRPKKKRSLILAPHPSSPKHNKEVVHTRSHAGSKSLSKSNISQ